MPVPCRLAYIGILICVVTMLPQSAAAMFAPEQQFFAPIVIFIVGQALGSILCLPQIFCAAQDRT